MTRSRDTVSGDLFYDIPRPAPAEPGTMNFRGAVGALLSDMIAHAHLTDPAMDRIEIAARASRLTGKEITVSMLNAYTAASRDDYNLPFWLLPAIETALGSTALTDWLVRIRGGRLLLGKETLDAEIGRIQGRIESDRAQLRDLQTFRRRAR